MPRTLNRLFKKSSSYVYIKDIYWNRTTSDAESYDMNLYALN